MAEATVEVELQQICTNRLVRARLEGVTPEELDLNSTAAIFGYFRVSARSDESLSSTEFDGLSYTMRGVDGEEEVDASTVISDRLKDLSSLVEEAIENDPEIRQQDDNVIKRVLPDDAVDENYDYLLVKQHLTRILQNFFSYEAIQDCTPIKLLINFAMVVRYCYSFCKRLTARIRELLGQVFSESVLKILCQVVSVLLQHLASIGWKALIRNIGGWAGALGSLALSQVTSQWLGLPLSSPKVYLAVSVLSGCMYLYLTYYKQS